MRVTVDELSTLHRMLGTIEGAVYGIGKREGIVYEAVETINEILGKAEVEEK
jgi:hypothetical protein